MTEALDAGRPLDQLPTGFSLSHRQCFPIFILRYYCAAQPLYRELLIFQNVPAATKFFTSGLELSGKAEGVAKVGNDALVDSTINQDVAPGIKSYVITDTGLIGQASVHGKKYYKLDALENPKHEETFDLSEEERGQTKE